MTPFAETLAAIREHFPDASLVKISAPSRACTACRREVLIGLNYMGAAVCTTCAPHAGSIAMMTTDLENAALEAGGAAGGGYLDSIEKFDLSALSEQEWATFLAKVLEGYSAHMREVVKETPPF